MGLVGLDLGCQLVQVWSCVVWVLGWAWLRNVAYLSMHPTTRCILNQCGHLSMFQLEAMFKALPLECLK